MNGNNYKNSHFGFGFRFRPKRKMGVSASFGFGRNEKKPFGRALNIPRYFKNMFKSDFRLARK